MEDNRKLIHERDVDIPLGILDDLRGFRDLDRLRPVHACLYDQLVNLRDRIQRFCVHAGNNLRDRLEAVHLVAGVDSLRRVTDFPVGAALQAGLFFDNRDAGFLGHARINRGLENNDCPFCQILSDKTGSAFNRRKVRRMVVIDRCRNRNDDEFRFPESFRICGKFHRCFSDRLVADLVCGVDAVLVFLNLRFIEVEADNLDLLRESNRDRHPDIAKAYQREFFLSVYQFFVKIHFSLPKPRGFNCSVSKDTAKF